MQTVNILEAAHEILKRSGWCQQDLAKDRRRQPVAPASPAAAWFSMTGALTRAAADLGLGPEALRKAEDHTGETIRRRLGLSKTTKPGTGAAVISCYNDVDFRTRAQVLRVLESAAAEARRRQEAVPAAK